MSSTSGIKATDELLTQFSEFLNSDKRSMFVLIENEACHPGQQLSGTADFISDFDKVRENLKHNEAAYFIHRLDDDGGNSDSNNKEFLFTAFVPDHAPVRSKMLYASSAAGLHQQLGGSDRFGDVVFWTELDEVSRQGWQQQQAHSNAVDPQTAEELALETALDHEADQMLGTSGRRSHLDSRSGGPTTSGSTLAMQLNDSVREALDQLQSMQQAVLGLHIDLTNEQVVVGKPLQDGLGLDTIDKVSPQYTLHKHGDSVVFIYTCPSQSKVKERMVYASNRQGVIQQLKSLGLVIKRVVEATDGDELAEEQDLHGEYSAPDAASKPKFNRPKRPGRR